jgi:hypothetical protein
MIEILNLVVKQCVLNQTSGYWLLFDALYIIISISIKLQVEYNSKVSIFPPLICGEFDAKLKNLYVKMVA